MHRSTATAFVKPVVEHWLKRVIAAPWTIDPTYPSHYERTLYKMRSVTVNNAKCVVERASDRGHLNGSCLDCLWRRNSSRVLDILNSNILYLAKVEITYTWT